MAAPAPRYRSYEEFEREELHQTEKFVHNLDDFHATRSADEDLNLFDKVDEEEDEDDDE